MTTGARKLQELATQKEQELHKIREEHYHALETSLKSCEEELEREKEKRKALEDDFRYNLTLIEQRDHELARYDTIFQELKKVVNSRVAELSDLRVQIDELQAKLKQAEEEKGQLKQYYIQRLEQQQIHMDQYCKSKDIEVTQQRTEYERLQRQLQQRLLQVEEELETEKQQLMTESEENMKSLRQEHQVKLDELAATLLSKESHIRQLQRELSTVQSCKEQTQKTASTVEEKVKELESLLREKDWDHIDAVNTLEARISELEGQLSHAEATSKNLRVEFDCRRVELERFAKEKDTALQTSKECHRVRETELEREVGEMRAQIEQLEVEGRRKEWNHKDELKERELTMKKLQSELVRVREEGERQLATHTQEKVQYDLQLQSLQTSCDKLRDDVNARIQDIERYKHELHLATERERSLERSKAQMELDWQVRLEEMERNQYGQQEELIKTLTVARDEALVQCKQVEEKLMERVRVCECIRQERDIALDALKKKGLTELAQDILLGRGSSSTLESLQRQNQELREVISHMRTEMEQLATSENQEQEYDVKKTTCSKSYTRYIEKELERLKQENKKFHDMHYPNRKPPTPPFQKGEKKSKVDTQVAQVLKAAIASFQKEKATYEFDLAQLRSRVRQLESSHRTHQEQVYLEKALQVPLDKVRQKLLQATQVIIQLVKEREEWNIREEELVCHVTQLKEQLKQENMNTSCNPPLLMDEDHLEEESDNPWVLPMSQENVPPQYTRHRPPSHIQKTSQPNSLLNQPPPSSRLDIHIKTKQPLSEHATNIHSKPRTHSEPTTHVISEPTTHFQTRPLLLITHDTDPHDNLSLSSLKFSDSSETSTLQTMYKALQLVDEEMTIPHHKSSTPIRSEEEMEVVQTSGKMKQSLVVEGKQMGHQKVGGVRGRGQVKYTAPLPRSRKQKVRNYNIRDND